MHGRTHKHAYALAQLRAHMRLCEHACACTPEQVHAASRKRLTVLACTLMSARAHGTPIRARAHACGAVACSRLRASHSRTHTHLHRAQHRARASPAAPTTTLFEPVTVSGGPRLQSSRSLQSRYARFKPCRVFPVTLSPPPPGAQRLTTPPSP
eukprot:6206658-Pleurochrysis_carterae.AAC.1